MSAKSLETAERATKRGRGRPRKVDALLTVEEAAERLGFGHWTLRSWMRDLCRVGDSVEPVLPVIRFGRRVRIDPAVLDLLPSRLERRLPRPAPSFFSARNREVGDE